MRVSAFNPSDEKGLPPGAERNKNGTNWQRALDPLFIGPGQGAVPGQPPSGYPGEKAQGLTWRYGTLTATTLSLVPMGPRKCRCAAHGQRCE